MRRALCIAENQTAMTAFILPLSDPAATDPEQVGPKAANLAALDAGRPADAGRLRAHGARPIAIRSRHLGIEDLLPRNINEADRADLAPAVDRRSGWRSTRSRSRRKFSSRCWRPGARSATKRSLGVVRSSALIEDRKGANFAGQFESFLGLSDETEFLTAVRACWAALWTSHARRYMENHELSPADTAMGVLIQPLISARASGGGLSETAEGQMLISRHLGPRLGDRAGRGGAGPHRAEPRTASCARWKPAARAIATPASTACRRRSWCPTIW